MKRTNPIQILNVAVRQAQALSEVEREGWNGWGNTVDLVPEFVPVLLSLIGRDGGELSVFGLGGSFSAYEVSPRFYT